VRVGSLRVSIVLMVVLAGCTGGSTSPPVATPSQSPTTTPTHEPSATQTETPSLAVNWVAVVVDGLNLREHAGTDALSLGLLPAGSAGMIAAGPVQADGYDWFALAGPGIPRQSGCDVSPSMLNCGQDWFGWVASSDADGNAWIVPGELECPAAPTTIEEVVAISRVIRLACFSGQTLSLDAYLSPVTGGRGCAPGYDVTPSWFGCAIQFLQATATEVEAQGPELPAHMHPDAGTCGYGGRSPDSCPYVPYIGHWIEVEGHFDDAAATACEAHPWAGTSYVDNPPDPELVVYQCREAFVVSSISPAN